MKYFIAKATGLILAINEDAKIGQGKHAVSVVSQYAARPDKYIPCKQDGTPLSDAKTTVKGTNKTTVKGTNKTPPSTEDKESPETKEPEGKE